MGELGVPDVAISAHAVHEDHRRSTAAAVVDAQRPCGAGNGRRTGDAAPAVAAGVGMGV